MMKKILSLCVLAVAAGCVTPPPARPVPVPPPPPAAPPPSTEDVERDAEQRARRLWEEATSLGRQGRWSEAEGRLRQAVQQRPQNSTYSMALSNALAQQGRDSEAADALWAGIRAQEAVARPNHRVLVVDYERLVDLLTRVGRAGEAQQARARQAEHRRLRDAGV